MRQRQGDHEFEASPGKISETLSQGHNKNKRAEGIGQVVEQGCEVVGSIQSHTHTQC
jgi:hypothetical protein